MLLCFPLSPCVSLIHSVLLLTFLNFLFAILLISLTKELSEVLPWDWLLARVSKRLWMLLLVNKVYLVLFFTCFLERNCFSAYLDDCELTAGRTPSVLPSNDFCDEILEKCVATGCGNHNDVKCAATAGFCGEDISVLPDVFRLR